MANQLTRLLSTEIRADVPIDTCISIRVLHERQEASAFWGIIFKGKDFRIITASMPMGEASKVRWTSHEKPLSFVEWLSEHGPIGYPDDDFRISDRTDPLVIKSLSYCHYLDNHYLIYCRALEALLVTNEYGLEMATRMESVMTCATENFRIYH